MLAFSLGCYPVQAVRATSRPLIVAAAGLCAAGCAVNHSTYYDGPAPAYVAQAATVRIEGDGMPSQAAPSTRIRQMPDDPSQPYSRDYGGTNPAGTIPAVPTVKASNDVAPQSTPIPDDLPPGFRRQLAAAVNAAG